MRVAVIKRDEVRSHWSRTVADLAPCVSTIEPVITLHRLRSAAMAAAPETLITVAQQGGRRRRGLTVTVECLEHGLVSMQTSTRFGLDSAREHVALRHMPEVSAMHTGSEER